MNDLSIIKLANNNNIEAMENLIDVLDINSVDAYGDSALHIATLNNNYKIAKFLIGRGINPNVHNQQGNTALHHAAEYNCIDIAKLIIANGGKLNIEDRYGNEPLWTATFEDRGGKRIEIIKLFLDHGADKNHKNKTGLSPSDFARQVKNTVLLDVFKKFPS